MKNPKPKDAKLWGKFARIQDMTWPATEPGYEDALKALAEKATPGPWYYDSYSKVFAASHTGEEEIDFFIAQTPVRCGDTATKIGYVNACYIAAFNPSTVLSLLARIERLEEMKDALEVFVEAGVDDGCGGYAWADQRIADAMLIAREALKGEGEEK